LAGLTTGTVVPASYHTAKHGVVALSECLFGELAHRAPGVGVTVLCPGFVKTNIFTSQRNRPEHLANLDPKPGARVANDEIVRIVESQAITPAEVADHVVRAVKEDRLWILTHPSMATWVEDRAARIVAAADA
jgi:NAD(P)-dependent dehydrogenase (short-subunit alcohol dehydrogenase family)